MTAIVQPALRPERSTPCPPPLRVIQGGRTRDRHAARYRRRRIVAAVLLVVTASVATIGVRSALGVIRPAAPGASAPAGGARAAPGEQAVVVRSGDTLWSIARRISPSGDVRAVVDRLASAHGLGPLQVGERLPTSGVNGR